MSAESPAQPQQDPATAAADGHVPGSGDSPSNPPAAEQVSAQSGGAENAVEARYDRIVWVDCEMTGLDLAVDVLVEIAVVITDAELNELDEGFSRIIRATPEQLAAMNPRVVELHEASGLLPLIPDGLAIEQAAAETLAYIKTHVPEPGRAPLAGSTVYVDRGFLAKQMPEVDQHLHYRVIDVSSIKELARRWLPKVYFQAPAKTGNHRALGDIRDSIAELRHYRQALFVPAAGGRND